MIGIGNSVLLSWLPSAEEQIVVGAESLEGPYLPVLEPIFDRHGERAMAIRATSPAEYFCLVPGRQFVDDFNPPPQPFAARNAWVSWFWSPSDANRFTVEVAEGALQVRNSQRPADGRVIIVPPGPDLEVRDFHASVDLVDWDEGGSELLIGIAARALLDRSNVSGSNGYIADIGINLPGKPGKAQLALYDGGPTIDPNPTVFEIDPDAAYRLVFSGVGNKLSARVVNLTDGGAVVAERARTVGRFSQGLVGLWRQGAHVGSLTLDNFLATGTQP